MPGQKATARRRNTRSNSNATADLTRNKIIDAAKRHFAEVGLQHASIRAITNLAGVNSALIGYYFGSNLQLYKEVISECTATLIKVRLQELDQLETEYAGRTIPLERLIAIYVRPFFSEMDNPMSDASIYMRFFGRLYTEPTDELREITRTRFKSMQTRFIKAIARSVPHLRKEDLFFRFGLFISSIGFFSVNTGILEGISDGKFDTTNSARLTQHFVSTFSALFRLPSDQRAGRPAVGKQRTSKVL